MRKMATIRKIDALRPIVGADAIECAIVGGWTCVVKKGEYVAGDLAVYCEIDSWIPYEVAPFLSKGNFPHVYNEVKGERTTHCKVAWPIVTRIVVATVYIDHGRIGIA